MFDKRGRYIIENYGRKSEFASFLPGISGRFGVPIWSFYVNRGQGITSFGSSDKDHSIMEFYPAHQAYQMTRTQGFRTFVKRNETYLEPFSEERLAQSMYIGMNEFEIEEKNQEEGIQTNVLYFTLPGEKIGGLVRQVTVKNIGEGKAEFQILDGMPAILPYGVSLADWKEMGQTVKAWMQVEDAETRSAYFRVRASIADSIAVQEIKEGNFSFAVDEQGEKLPMIVDSKVIFSYDTSLTRAVEFERKHINELLMEKQIAENNLPCSFFAMSRELEAGESVTIYELIGMAAGKDLVKEVSDKCVGTKYFETKRNESMKLTDDLCQVIHTKTGNPVFDAYCRQTYLDNLLRGGYPVKMGEKKIFYLYSRKHGDVERDYNFFQMLPEFYSQGNANFRDVNQNRRCDVLFTPYVDDLNIKTFYNLIQTDGYNPLQVQKAEYTIAPEKIKGFRGMISDDCFSQFEEMLKHPFTPGTLAGFVMEKMQADEVSVEKLIGAVMEEADSSINAAFGEGYWTDHWTYNLDLAEAWLSVFPDREEELFFEDASYTYFESRAAVNPRRLRYEETAKGIRQYHTLNHERKKNTKNELVCEEYGSGKVYHTTLLEKLLLLCAVKLATLDPYGMGIEMEGGKPGWYDALNGMPGLLGSSMCETYELCRMVEFMLALLKKYRRKAVCGEDVAILFQQIYEVCLSFGGKWHDLESWNQLNDIKESYREKTLFGVSGKKMEMETEELVCMLTQFHELLQTGIQRALQFGGGVSPAYFTFEVTDYRKEGEEIELLNVKPMVMPHFLEGPVRFMKLNIAKQEKENMYQKVKAGGLYDTKLHMYKVNESLEKVSYEVGRCRAFTPGWLENESIWLHMEYKYLLELLKSGMYLEFAEDFRAAAVPFLDAEKYGRSPLENSSFIVSSANQNEKLHGKGFVARLSGSTAEFIHMWQIMMFGAAPFSMGAKGLTLQLAPSFPEYLIGEEKKIEAVFLGTVKTIFYVSEKKDYFPGDYRTRLKVTFADGSSREYGNGSISGADAVTIREGNAERIEVFLD